MSLYFNVDAKIKITLNRDLTKHIKRGNPWVFADTITKPVKAKSGSLATLVDHKGNILAQGFYCPKINLAFRILTIGEEKINSQLIEKRFLQALQNKKHLYHEKNNCFRLFNGEGDELPGLICDIYADLAVIKLDGEASENFWRVEDIAQFLGEQNIIKIKTVYFKRKNNEEVKGKLIKGEGTHLEKHRFIENGVNFETNIIDAAKTGFFLDQRENRKFIGDVAKDKTVLNLFGYTGGFSVYAGLGGAKEVHTVDIASYAIIAAKKNWEINQLPSSKHQAICEDAFKFVKDAKLKKMTWDIVITDPPSFAPNQKSLDAAKAAYVEIFSDSLKLVRDGGFFVASSCSGHISFEVFLDLCQEALSKTRSRGKIYIVKGQPEDHPYPFALPEMRYLKFVYMQVFKD